MFQDIDPDILEAATLVENEYQEFFKSKLKEYGVESLADLDYEQSKAFFDEIRNEWGNGSVNESEEDEINEEDEDSLNEGVEDVYSTIYNNLVKPNDLTVGNTVSFPYSGYDTDFKIELIVNPTCFGMPTIYHLKALNGPCEGEECVFEEEDLYNKLDSINESEDCEIEIIDKDDEDDEIEVNEEDELMDKIVEALENNSMFESEDEEDELNESEEEEVNEEEEESLDEEEDDELNESEELEESTDFDITKENDKKLEEILKVFLKSKAMDGDDYEIVSKGNKLILKVYNDKFVKDIEKLLK